MDIAKIKRLIEEYNDGRISDEDKRDLLYYIDLYPDIIFYPSAKDALDAYNYKNELLAKAKSVNREKGLFQVNYAVAAILLILICSSILYFYTNKNRLNTIAEKEVVPNDTVQVKFDTATIDNENSSEENDILISEDVFKLGIVSNVKYGYSENSKKDSIIIKFRMSQLSEEGYKFEGEKLEIKSNVAFTKSNSVVLYLKFDNFTKGYYIYRDRILYSFEKTSEYLKLKKEEDFAIVSFAKKMIQE